MALIDIAGLVQCYWCKKRIIPGARARGESDLWKKQDRAFALPAFRVIDPFT